MLEREFAPGRWQAPTYCALVTILVALVWLAPALPTQDGPSHVYGLMVMAEVLAGEGPWRQHFEVHLEPSPNLGFLMVGAPLVHVLGAKTGALAAERAAVSLYLLLVAAGVPFFLRSFRRGAWPLSFVALPLALNYPLFLGFYAYVIGSAALLPSLGLLWLARDRPLPQRAALLTLLASVTALLHLIGGGLVLLAGALLELTRKGAAGCRLLCLAEGLARAVAVTAPAVLLAAGYAATHPADFGAATPVRHQPLVLGWMLATFGTVVLSPRQMLPTAIALAWLAAAFPWRHAARRDDTRFLTALATAVTVLYLALPNVLASGSYLNERLPWLLPLIVLPVLRPPGPPPAERLRKWCATWPVPGSAHATFVAALALAWVLVTLAPAARLARATPAAFLVPPGASVAVARFAARPLWPLHDPDLHLASRVGVASGALDLAFHEFYLAHHPLRWRHADWPSGDDLHDLYYRPRQAPAGSWAQADYVVALETNPRDRAWLAARCRLVRAGADTATERWRASLWADCARPPAATAPWGTAPLSSRRP